MFKTFAFAAAQFACISNTLETTSLNMSELYKDAIAQAPTATLLA